MDIQFLSKTLIRGYGTTEMRCVQPSTYLRNKSWDVGYGCIYRSLPKAKKIIVFHRTSLDSHTKKYLKYAKAKGLITIYDIDDLLFSRDLLKSSNEAKAYLSMMKACDVVLVSTSFLQKEAELFHSDVRVVKNGLSQDFLEKANSTLKTKQNNKPITIAYLSGSIHHDYDFKIVEKDLLRILNDTPEVRVLIMGKIRFSDSFYQFNKQFQYHEFVSYSDFWQIFNEIDINIAPLDILAPFSQARSELKYIEAGLFGIPTIASPTGTYCETIKNGVNGLLVEDGHWYEAIKHLASDESLRKTMGENARIDVLENYSPEIRSNQWNELITSIMKKYGENSPTGHLKAGIPYMKVLYVWLKRWIKIKRSFLNNRI